MVQPERIDPWSLMLHGLPSVALLGAALFRWPSSYYTALRILVFAFAAFMVWRIYERHRTVTIWAALFVIAGLVFNPFVPLGFTRGLWQVADVAVAALFVAHWFAEFRELRRRALAALPNTLLGRRDRALLLVGFGGALRRDELVGLEVAARNGAVGWIEELPDGLVIHLSHSKTDQTGEGQTVGVPFGSNPDTCPVRAYRAWLEASGIAEGPAFRSIVRKRIGEGPMTGAAVAFIVKRVVRAGAMAEAMPRAEAEAFAARFAGHSLRAGLATSAALNDAAGYIREARLFKQNAAGMAGL